MRIQSRESLFEGQRGKPIAKFIFLFFIGYVLLIFTENHLALADCTAPMSDGNGGTVQVCNDGGPTYCIYCPANGLPCYRGSCSKQNFHLNPLDSHSGILNGNNDSVLANGLQLRASGNCDCSKCRSDQVCCQTANGYCGCFPGGIQCPTSIISPGQTPTFGLTFPHSHRFKSVN